MKRFCFSVPVSGTEYFSVEAETLEEAIEKLTGGSCNFKDGDEIDWDMGWERNTSTFLEEHLDDEFEI